MYKKNTEEELNRCLISIENQNHTPSEIILIIDGPISELLFNCIQKWSETLPIKSYTLADNMGLAFALNYGMRHCFNDWVFRIDVDDVCAPGRFQNQINFVESNPQVDILGGNILCFSEYPHLFRGRKVPITSRKIYRFIKFRNPVNHSSVFFNRHKILEIGGYPNARLGQDYLLWINSICNGLRIENMKDVLVHMQVDSNAHQRRGLKNFSLDSQPYKEMLRLGVTNYFEFSIGISLRFLYCTYSSLRGVLRL